MLQHILEPKKDSTCIRELSIGVENEFYDTSTGNMAVKILAPNQVSDDGPKAGTITSYDLLDMSGSSNSDFAVVCDALGANPTAIQLQRLRFGRIDDIGCDALIRSLPKLLCLKQLVIDSVAQGGSSKNLLCALRRNGSLEDVVIGSVDRTEQPFFNEHESRLVQSYCRRNGTIPALAAKPRLHYDSDEIIATTDLYLFPTLFAGAKQATRTAPNVMLIGLLAARDSIGANSDGKLLPS